MKRRRPMRIDVEGTRAAGFKDPRSHVRNDRFYRFGVDMTELRKEAFSRSGGYCEYKPRMGALCNRNISWETFELDHEPPLSRGGSDSLDGVRCVCRRCHASRHNRILQWSKGGKP